MFVARPALALAALLLVAACAPRGPGASVAAGAAPPAAPLPGHDRLEHGVAGAPFVAGLDGRWLGAGEVRLEAHVDLLRPLAAPLVLSLRLPPGARLTSGDGREHLAAPKAGSRVIRVFRVIGVAGGERLAFTAEQAVPEREAANATVFWPPEAAAPPPTFGRVHPVRAGGVVVEEAVEIHRETVP